MKSKKSGGRLFLLGAAIIASDFLTKQIVKCATPDIRMTGWLSIRMHTNTGIGFGMFQGQNLLMLGISVIIIGILSYYLFKVKDKTEQLFLVCIIGGALGNAIDRILYGKVIDFIALSFWPAFNIADSAITIGAAGLLMLAVKKRRD